MVTHTGPFRLRDGRDVWLRPLRSADAPALVTLFGRLSEQTIRRRFMQHLPNFNLRAAEALTAVDQVRQVAIAAVPDPSASDTIVAVGRFHGDDGGQRAELALLVEDDYQGSGLGQLLLAHLIEEADRRRICVLDGVVQHTNQPMLRLLRSSGRQLDVSWRGGDTLDIRLQVAPRAAQPG